MVLKFKRFMNLHEDISLPSEVLSGFEVTQVDKSPRSTVQIRVSSTDRYNDRDEILRRLTSAGITASTVATNSSVDPIQGVFDNRKFRINVKPKSGGMGETTLNSSITELFPCIAFEKKLNPKNAEDFMAQLMSVDVSKLTCVLSKDKDAAKETINKAEGSSKFADKMQNAIGILKFINAQNAHKTISNVYWGYRAKPSGVPYGHPGDIFLKFGDGSLLGVSLKAGKKKSKEPQLNTYHKTIFKNTRGGASFNDQSGSDFLRKKIYDEIYSKIKGMPPLDNFDGGKSGRHKDKKETVKAINSLSTKDQNTYYDKYLAMVKQGLIERFNKNKKESLEFIKSAILRDAPDVPTMVIKASGSDYEEITDRNELGVFLPQVEFVQATSKSTKQDWVIELKSAGQSVKMGMTVRSSSGGKLKQFSLKVTYTGIEK